MSKSSGLVRARGLKRSAQCNSIDLTMSGLVRARGLKHLTVNTTFEQTVRARKSPWIETKKLFISSRILCQGS